MPPKDRLGPGILKGGIRQPLLSDIELWINIHWRLIYVGVRNEVLSVHVLCTVSNFILFFHFSEFIRSVVICVVHLIEVSNIFCPSIFERSDHARNYRIRFAHVALVLKGLVEGRWLSLNVRVGAYLRVNTAIIAPRDVRVFGHRHMGHIRVSQIWFISDFNNVEIWVLSVSFCYVPNAWSSFRVVPVSLRNRFRLVNIYALHFFGPIHVPGWGTHRYEFRPVVRNLISLIVGGTYAYLRILHVFWNIWE